jgi:hypothetical protein
MQNKQMRDDRNSFNQRVNVIKIKHIQVFRVCEKERERQTERKREREPDRQ